MSTQSLMVRFAGCGICLLLVAGCSGRVERSNPFHLGAGPHGPFVSSHTESYVWARNDGRRMADNPALLRLGQRDQRECRAEARAVAHSEKNAYFDCMKGRGYSPRQRR